MRRNAEPPKEEGSGWGRLDQCLAILAGGLWQWKLRGEVDSVSRSLSASGGTDTRHQPPFSRHMNFAVRCT